MELNTLLNANASNIAVTTTATLLTALLDTAAAGSNVFRPHLDAVDISVEDGDVRILYDGNVPTASKGILLKRGGLYRLRRTPISMLRFISATGGNVSVSIQVGRSEAQEPSSVGFAPYLLEQIAGEQIAANRLAVEQNFVGTRHTADGQCKTAAGLLHTVVISQPAAATPTAGVLTIYDSLTETGTVLFQHYFPASAIPVPITVTLNKETTTGIYVGFDGTLAGIAVDISAR